MKSLKPIRGHAVVVVVLGVGAVEVEDVVVVEAELRVEGGQDLEVGGQ